eukprot:Sdes_comp18961_c0_seq2m9490
MNHRQISSDIQKSLGLFSEWMRNFNKSFSENLRPWTHPKIPAPPDIGADYENLLEKLKKMEEIFNHVQKIGNYLKKIISSESVSNENKLNQEENPIHSHDLEKKS